MADFNIYDMADTWNAGGTTFTAIKMDVTDTASAAASLLMDLQIGGISKFKVRKNGWTDTEFVGTPADGAITGLFCSGGQTFLYQAGTSYFSVAPNFVSLAADTALRFNSDTLLERDAAGIFAQRNGTTAQAKRLYDTFTSATDFHRLGFASGRADLSGVSGASVTATGLIPDGAVLVGLTSKVTTGLGTGNGTTGYTIGDGSDVDRWGAVVGTAAGTSSDNTNWTAGTIQAFTAAQDVVITASGGNFNGTGVIRVTAFYLRGECD
jgi:hypothetical protein